VTSEGAGTTPRVTKYGHKIPHLQAWLQLSQQDISMKQTLRKSLKQRGRKKFSPSTDVQWVHLSFPVASDKKPRHKPTLLPTP